MDQSEFNGNVFISLVVKQLESGQFSATDLKLFNWLYMNCFDFTGDDSGVRESGKFL